LDGKAGLWRAEWKRIEPLLPRDAKPSIVSMIGA
jgi:hypothetical protein